MSSKKLEKRIQNWEAASAKALGHKQQAWRFKKRKKGKEL